MLADDGNKVTLIMSENLGDNVEWYADAKDNSYGPITALEELSLRTNDLEMPEFSYTLSGLAEDGTTQRYEDMTVTGKARLLTYEEAIAVKTANNATLPNWMYTNLKNTASA